MYRESTHGFEVIVDPRFLPEHSRAAPSITGEADDEPRFVFAYHVTITNAGSQPARLVSRRWVITDGQGEVREVNGPGVVGQQPRLEPGESFAYSSFCPLPTPTGNMRGSYQMVTEEGERFEIRIPLFFLRGEDSPTPRPPGPARRPTIH